MKIGIKNEYFSQGLFCEVMKISDNNVSFLKIKCL